MRDKIKVWLEELLGLNRYALEEDVTAWMKSVLLNVKDKHESLAQGLELTVRNHVDTHIAERQNTPVGRHVACPVCGKSYNLQEMGIMYHVRSATICCDGCKNHFEVRPSFFWEKIEVERR